MTSQQERLPHRRRAAGYSLLMMVVTLVALFALISLGVDWGRVQVAQAQLQGAADAAARYAVTGLQNDLRGQSAVESNAREVIRQNPVDGRQVNFRPQEDLEIGFWDPNLRRFTSTTNLDLANAVRVTLRKSAARDDAIPLTFAAILGRTTAEIRAQATAYTDFGGVAGGAGNGRFEYYIPATSNPWLSGMPAGSIANPNNPANNPDYAGSEFVDSGFKKSGTRTFTNWSTLNGSGGSDSSNSSTSQTNWAQWGDYAPKKGSPIRAGMIAIQPGATITFDGLNGGANNFSSTTLYSADGNTGWVINNLRGAENGMSDLRAPINSVIAVFLSDAQPSLAGSTPSRLDFSSAGSRDFLVLRPELRQMFFIGDGRTSAGETQRFVVPPGATRLYIGTMDGWEWNNNVGGFEVTAHATGRVVLAK